MKAGLLLTFTVPGKLYLLTIEALGSLKSLVFCRYMYYMYCRYHVAFARCHTHLMEQHLQASNSVHQRPCTSQMMQNVRFATTLTLNALWNRRSNWLSLPIFCFEWHWNLDLDCILRIEIQNPLSTKIVIKTKWAVSWDWKKMENFSV